MPTVHWLVTSDIHRHACIWSKNGRLWKAQVWGIYSLRPGVSDSSVTLLKQWIEATLMDHGCANLTRRWVTVEEKDAGRI